MSETNTGAPPTGEAEASGRDRRRGVAYAPHRRTNRGFGQRVVERAAVLGFRSASFTVGHVSPRLAMPVAEALSGLSYHAWPGKRRAILDNASHVLGMPIDDPKVRRLAKRIYANNARFVVELMRLPHLPVDEPGRLVQAEGERGGDSFVAIHERVKAEGRGLIVVSAHIGSIDVLAAAFALRGMPTYGVADDSAFPELLEVLGAQRRRWGIKVINWRNLREMFRVLRSGGIVGLVVDWGYRADDVPVRLFGKWTTLPAGPAVLAARTGAMVLPVVNRRLRDGRYEASHFDPIEVPDGSPAGIARATQQIADAIEQMVAVDPGQWYIFKPMWPESEAELRELEARHRGMLATQPGATPAAAGQAG